MPQSLPTDRWGKQIPPSASRRKRHELNGAEMTVAVHLQKS